MSSNWEKRPKVWDIGDCKHRLSTPYERAYRCLSSQGVVYQGFADIGSSETEKVWQISQNKYDSTGMLVAVLWAIDDLGRPSGEYCFAWSDVENLQFG